MSARARMTPLGDRLPFPNERDAANQLRSILANQTGDNEQKLTVLEPATDTRADVILSSALSRLLMDVLRPIAAGDAVTLVPVSQMLTTQQAADILNVSRPYLIGLLERHEIKHEKVGRHRRIRADDLFGYKDRRDEDRESALAELAQLDAQLV